MKKGIWKSKPPFGATLTALGIAMMAGLHTSHTLGGRGPLFIAATDDAGAETEEASGIKKCKDKLQELSAALDELEQGIDAETDEGAKAEMETRYKAKSREYDKAKATLKRLQAKAERNNDLAVANALATVRVPGAIPAGGIHAEPKDHDKDEKEREGLFTDYFYGKALSDVGRDALRPTSKGWKQGSEGVIFPKRLAALVLPESRTFGKAQPLTSTQASPANLFQGDFQKQLNAYAGEGAAVFPNTFKVPTKSGSVIWPKLSQAAPAAEGAADEFAEYGYVACAWTAEGAEKPGTEPVFTQQTMPTYELAAKTKLSRTLMNRSAIDLESLIQSLFRGSLLHKIDNALINGDGNGKPTGVLQTAGIGTVARATAGQINYDDLVDLETQLAPQLREGARWVGADSGVQYLKKKKDSQGRPLFLPTTSNAGDIRTPENLIGYPVTRTQRTTLGTAGDMILGNWAHYVCPVEQEVVLMKSEHQYMDQGVILFVVFVQIGGKVAQVRAFSKLIDH